MVSMFLLCRKNFSLLSMLTGIAISAPFFEAFAEEIQVSSPYTLPWQLRSVVPANALRLDSAVASYRAKAGNSNGLAGTSVLTGMYKVSPDVALLTRIGMIRNHPPAPLSHATSFLNPLVGVTYLQNFSNTLRLSLFFGLTLPIGTGGGNQPDPSIQAANSVGILARSAMDNALFAVNYLALIPGVSVAYLASDVTLQVEASVLQLTRVRGDLIDKDASRTNFTSGIALGYAVSPLVSALTELRYQRWLRHETVSLTASPAVENLSLALGPRFTVKFDNFTAKPGVAYVQGLAGAMANANYSYPSNSYKVIYFDLPISF